MDHFPEDELLNRAAQGDISALAALDAQGFLLKPGEAADAFVGRIRAMHARFRTLDERMTADGSCEVFPGIVIQESARIPDEIMDEASQETESRYGFAIRWAPGYFPSGGLGFLWGGCALSDDEPDCVPVFLIRGSFRESKRFFIYSRDELLSHELCHTARAPLSDRIFEEHFAYAGSHSALRRYMGNCFQSDYDALFFLLPILLLLGIQIAVYAFDWHQIPAYPFWIFALAWPAYLLIRNALQRKTYFRAERTLRECGFARPAAVLFRCTSDEIARFARLSASDLKQTLDELAQTDLRMKITLYRFQNEGELNHADDQRSECLPGRDSEPERVRE